MSNSFHSVPLQQQQGGGGGGGGGDDDDSVVVMTISSDDRTESPYYLTESPYYQIESPFSLTESLPDSLKSDGKTEDCYRDVSKPERLPSPEEEQEEEDEEEVEEEVDEVEEEYFLADNYTDLEKSIAELQIKKTKSLKKVTTLWDTTAALPITTHDDLNPIMVKLGFVSLPVVIIQPSFSPAPATEHDPYNVAWKEYSFVGNESGRIRPRLPHPRIDGLHVKTYKLFIHAVGIHIGHERAQSFFHIKEIPADERLKEEEFDFDDVIGKSYRKGCVDGTTEFLCKVYRIDSSVTSEEVKISDEDRRPE